MARIRSIKPEFWTSAQVLECSRNARLLFIGLWTFADDHGRHPDSPKQCKAEVFPADDLSIDEVERMLSELSANNLITRYVVDGRGFLQITGWHHQRIDKPQKPKYPGPDEADSKNIPGTLPPDRKGSEGKGSEKKGSPSAGRAKRARRPTHDYPEDFQRFWNEYPRRAGDDPKRRALRSWNARVNDGASPDDMIQGAIRYCRYVDALGKANTEFVMQAARFLGPEDPPPFARRWDPGNGQMPQSAVDKVAAANRRAEESDEREQRTIDGEYERDAE